MILLSLFRCISSGFKVFKNLLLSPRLYDCSGCVSSGIMFLVFIGKGLAMFIESSCLNFHYRLCCTVYLFIDVLALLYIEQSLIYIFF